MIILGLTGSIGMGKTRAAENFRRLGVPVHDADKAVHDLLSGDADVIAEIGALIPGAVKKGALDRAAIAGVVFSDPEALEKIEQIVHPKVRLREKRFLERTARDGRRLVVLDVPLLFETGGDKRCDGVITVSAPAFIQRQRVLRRRDMTPEKLAAILARQMADAEKCKRSDFVVKTGLGRGYSLHQILNIVSITRNWQGRHWPPRVAPLIATGPVRSGG
ncbi:MAG: dephospho-CoA kinase [Proteobacteria bacterium]|nr:dephospho-CoA kinase [Pseudomonadota bacterium]MDA1021755.1 dephospho-CoA kinase [Pseudomonadota bacterium]